jgi:hypothetical protein
MKLTREQVIEMACERAHDDLVKYWEANETEQMEFEESGELRYTPRAQRIFNRYYDDHEGEIYSEHDVEEDSI